VIFFRANLRIRSRPIFCPNWIILHFRFHLWGSLDIRFERRARGCEKWFAARGLLRCRFYSRLARAPSITPPAHSSLIADVMPNVFSLFLSLSRSLPERVDFFPKMRAADCVGTDAKINKRARFFPAAPKGWSFVYSNHTLVLLVNRVRINCTSRKAVLLYLQLVRCSRRRSKMN
jgi:hypothetical protein